MLARTDMCYSIAITCTISLPRFYVSTVSVMYSTSIEAQPPVVTRARVFTAEPLDREDVAMYQFSLIAQDVSQSPLSTSIPLTVSIVERNDNAPVFTSPNFTFTVPEDANNTLVSEFMVRACVCKSLLDYC